MAFGRARGRSAQRDPGGDEFLLACIRRTAAGVAGTGPEVEQLVPGDRHERLPGVRRRDFNPRRLRDRIAPGVGPDG